MFQLTRINAGTSMDIEYNYTAGSNNGRITSSMDHVTGENVTYTYDTLNRLTKAETADSLWGNAYTYDGWGNLLSKTVTKGTAPAYSATIDPATNGGPGQESASVNADVDVERRNLLVQTGTYWSYDGSGKRAFKETLRNTGNPNSQTTCEFYFYGISGQRLATYTCSFADQDGGDGSFTYSLVSRNEYFAGRPLKLAGVAVVTDRLGSVRWNGNGDRFNYYPYGEERSTTTNGQEKFGTYFRDSNGLDYADQRYYDSAAGRFTTPDPLGLAGADSIDPASWNQFAYTGGDPINYGDPTGASRIVTESIFKCFDAWSGEKWILVGCQWSIEDRRKPLPVLHPRAPTPRKLFDLGPVVAAARRAAIDGAQSHLDPNNPANADCLALFNTGGEGLSPSDLLSKLDAGNTSYGTITYGEIINPQVAATTAALYNDITAAPVVGAAITLNDSFGGAFLGFGTNPAATILHELVHAFEIIYAGSYKSPFENERAAPTQEEFDARSERNSQKIKDACFK